MPSPHKMAAAASATRPPRRSWLTNPNTWLTLVFTAAVLLTVVVCYPYAVITGVYLVSCGVFQVVVPYFLRLRHGTTVRADWEQKKAPSTAQRAESIANSLFNTLVGDYLVYQFVRPGGDGAGLLYTHEHAWPGLYNFAYMFLSPLVLLFVHDTWFYFMHRLLHVNKALYSSIHAWHHARHAPECFDLFFMHPLESLVVVMLPYLVTPHVIPQHWFIFEGMLILTTVIDVYGHIGYETAPFHPIQLTWYVHVPLPWRKIFLGAVDHDVHHRYVRGNYALFYRFWDHALGTLLPYQPKAVAAAAAAGPKAGATRAKRASRD